MFCTYDVDTHSLPFWGNGTRLYRAAGTPAETEFSLGMSTIVNETHKCKVNVEIGVVIGRRTEVSTYPRVYCTTHLAFGATST